MIFIDRSAVVQGVIECRRQAIAQLKQNINGF